MSLTSCLPCTRQRIALDLSGGALRQHLAPLLLHLGQGVRGRHPRRQGQRGLRRDGARRQHRGGAQHESTGDGSHGPGSPGMGIGRPRGRKGVCTAGRTRSGGTARILPEGPGLAIAGNTRSEAVKLARPRPATTGQRCPWPRPSMPAWLPAPPCRPYRSPTRQPATPCAALAPNWTPPNRRRGRSRCAVP